MESNQKSTNYDALIKAGKYPSWVNDPNYAEYYKTHKICRACGEIVSVKDAVKNRWSFYHATCAPQTSKFPHPCANCGEMTTNAKWCSKECQNEYLNKTHAHCVVCGNLTRWTKHLCKTTGRTYPTCSPECKEKWHNSDEYWELRYKPYTGDASYFSSSEFREMMSSRLQSNQLWKVAVRKRGCNVSEEEYNERWQNIAEPSYVMKHCSCNGVYIPSMFREYFFAGATTELKYRKILEEKDPDHFRIKSSVSNEQLALYQKLVYNYPKLEFKLEVRGPKNPHTRGTFRFDIGCFKRGDFQCAIEYDGVWFHTRKNPRRFIESNMERDRTKDTACSELGIPLFRVRSDHYESDYNTLTNYLDGLQDV